MKEYVMVQAKEMEELNELLNSYARERFSLVSYQCRMDMSIMEEKHVAIMEKDTSGENGSDYSLVCEGISIDRLEEICCAEKSGGLLIFPGGDKIEALNLTARSYNCLKNAGYDTISQLMLTCDADLQMVRNLGRVSFFEIKDKLSAMIEQGMRKGDENHV